MSSFSLTRLLQMASQAFPIGGYSHSQGLEAAIECGLVAGEAAVGQWIGDVLAFSLGPYELACLRDMSVAWQRDDIAALIRSNEEFLATRESAELRSASVQMGFSMRALLQVLPALPAPLLDTLGAMAEPSLPCVWSGLATAWSVPVGDSVTAYAWSWAENQVLVAMKSVPIGQSAGQRILSSIGPQIEAWARSGEARARSGEALAPRTEPAARHRESNAGRSNFAPGLAILSAQHETQYSRLFRS
jgi:urease accessory protein